MPIQSLEPIREVLETGQRPVKVACTDFSDYICKYPRLTPSHSLMTEWICAHAARDSSLYVPEFDLVSVLPEHAPGNLIPQLLPGARLDLPMFGSRHTGGMDMDKRMLRMLASNRYKSKLEQRDQLLQIALFDIWVANEDRHGNNYNLLLGDFKGKYRWMVIDHGACFNSQAGLNQVLAPLSFEESLISSELFAIVFQKPPNFVSRIHAVCNELENWRKNALQHVEQWVVDAPEQWGIDRSAWLAFLRDRWLSDEWTAQTQETFLAHTQLLINA
ncbi:MAG: HipA family kinase [Flavobacteriales bacterium]|jgi:hypothetical protein